MGLIACRHLEDRVKAFEATGRADDSGAEVERASSQVRRMQGRISIMQPHTVLAARECLVESAHRAGHKDAGYYQWAFNEVKNMPHRKI